MKIPENLDFNWKELEIPELKSLIPAREQLHYAVQFIALTGKFLIEQRPDDSHTSLSWDHDLSAFVGEPIINNAGYFIALSPSKLELSIHDQAKNIINSKNLDKNTRDSMLIWLKSALKEISIDSDDLSLQMHYEIPDHAIAHGRNFEIKEPEYFAILSDIYANAAYVLSAVQQSITGSSPVLCWPHHFDIAMLITLDPEKDAEQARSIGVGMSPGDATYAEPYFYITPWPYPEKSVELPDLNGSGFWHTEGWVGAVLPLSDILKAPVQQKMVEDYVLSGIKSSLALLGG